MIILKILYIYLFKKNKSRFLSIANTLTYINIIVSSFFLVLSLSIINGFSLSFMDKFLNIIPHAFVINSSGSAIKQPQIIIDQLKAQENIEEVTSYTNVFSLLRYTNKETKSNMSYVIGVNPINYEKVSNISKYITSEKNSSLTELLNTPNSIVIGQGIAQTLNVTLGDNISLYLLNKNTQSLSSNTYLKVVGLINSGGFLDYSLAIIDKKLANSILKYETDWTDSIQIKFKDPLNPYLMESIQYLNTLTFKNWKSTNNNIYNDIQLIHNIINFIFSIIFFLVLLNIISSNFMLMRSREKEFILLRELGLKQYHFYMIFVLYSLFITVVSLVIGISLGIIVSLNITNIQYFIESIFNFHLLNSKNYFISELIAYVKFADIFKVIIFFIYFTLFANAIYLLTNKYVNKRFLLIYISILVVLGMFYII